MVKLRAMGTRHKVGVDKRRVRRSENIVAKRLDIFCIVDFER